MSLTYAGYVSFNGSNPSNPASNSTSGPFTNAGNNCLENRPGTNEIWAIQVTTTQHLYGIDASTLNVLATTGGFASGTLGGTSPASCAGIAFPTLNGLASALVFNSVNSVTNTMEISTGYITNQTNTGVTGVYGKLQQQAAASLVTPTTVYATSRTVSSLFKWTTANFTAAILTPDWLNNDTACCILPIANGNFLIGTVFGSIFEMDVNANKIGQWQAQPETSWESYQANVDNVPAMAYLQFYDNMVLAIDSHGSVWKIFWPTKTTILHDHSTDGVGGGIAGGTSNTQIQVACAPGASGYMIMPPFWAAGDLNSVIASDWTQTPITAQSFMLFQYTAGTNSIPNAAYAGPCQRIAFYHQTPNLLFFLNFSPQSARVEVSSSLFDNGSYQKGRVIRMVDSGSGLTVVQDIATDAVASNSFPVPTGKTIIEIATYGEGVNEKASLSTYGT